MTVTNKAAIMRTSAITALAWAALVAAGPAAAQAPAKELSDKSVLVLMEYAWTILPDQMRLADRTIKVDKKNKKKETMVPIDTARDVVKAGYMSAQAQLCDMLEDQVANFDALMRRERNKKPAWTDEQLLYITTLHRMTIHMAAGKLRVVDKSNDEQQIILEAIEPSKDTCNDEKRGKVREQIATYVKTAPAPDPSTLKKAAPAAAPAPQPTPAAAKDAPKK
ncbi:MAG: hypothetical protein ACKVP7_00200 [Hyphomicrobiaceae bacterium]